MKIYNGKGADKRDGYDLDGIYAHSVSYKAKHCKKNAKVKVKCKHDKKEIHEHSCKDIVIKSCVEDLKKEDIEFDIVVGDDCRIGKGRIFLNKGVVDVEYKFDDCHQFDTLREENVKIEICSNLNEIINNGKFLEKDKLIKRERITKGDFFVRLDFEVNIPTALCDNLNGRYL